MAEKRSGRGRDVTGWCAVSISTVFTCLWAYWGIIENFHEGWFYRGLGANLALMFGQYLMPTLLFLALTLLGIRWHRAAAVVLAGLGVYLGFFFFRGSAGLILIGLPMLGLAALYWFGEARPRRRAVWLAAGLPALTLIVCGVEPAWRVSTRVDDGNLGERDVAGNGVHLVWAPQGPGWPAEGVTWAEAMRRCRYLSADGKRLAGTPQDIWRLPTVDEAVRSQARHGLNSGGRWDPATRRASYAVMPDKEPPLWDTHSQVIYWWTSTEVDEKQAYIVVYNGGVWPRTKTMRPAYLGFRAVRAP